MRNLFFLLIIFVSAQSCSTLNRAGSQDYQRRTSPGVSQKSSTSLKFIDNVSIAPVSNYEAPTIINKKRVNENAKPVLRPYFPASYIEQLSPLEFKYAILENVAVEDLQNKKLLGFMEEWYGTKYRFGGTVKGGIDCSAFSSTLMANVFGVNDLPRMAKDQYAATPRITKDQLQEGDLVFFHTYGTIRTKRGRGRRHSRLKPAPLVTHVGIYLRNNKFIHASVSGVMISDLGEGYYASHYVGAGRALEPGMNDAAINSK